jgi:hypothetical protein
MLQAVKADVNLKIKEHRDEYLGVFNQNEDEKHR